MPYPDKKSRCLLEEIEAAFADTPQPLGQIIPGTCWCDECSVVQDWLGGKHWRRFLRKGARGSESLEMDMCVLNAQPWHFFLPALLIQSIKGDDGGTSHLDPTSALHRGRSKYMDEAQLLMREERSRQLRAERFNLLTKRQCQAVQHYIRYVAGRSEAKSSEAEMTAKYPERFAASRERHQKEYATLLEFWRNQELAATS
jgi:hypothetical protein